MAEAISYRRGTTEENDQFIGVEGEIVVDMGSDNNSLHSMNNNNAFVNGDTKGAPTLRFHLGNSQVGGVVLARADMANVDTASLATRDEEAADMYHKGKNLLYADLYNIYYNSDAAAAAQDVLDSYGMAYKNTTNINTADLVNSAIHNGKILDKSTGEYIDAPGNKPLAYKDTTNINTADLVSAEIHDGVDGNKPLSYADASNTSTIGLAERTATIEYDGSSLHDLEVDTNKFTSQMDVSVPGQYTFIYVASETTNNESSESEESSVVAPHWEYNGNSVELATYGISYREGDTPANGDKIIVTFAYYGKNLAYADTTNINTSFLLDKTIHQGRLPNFNSVVEDCALLDYQMSNISDLDLKARMDKMFDSNVFMEGYERISFKNVDNITSHLNSENYYPSNNAIYNFLNQKVNENTVASSDLHNITQLGWNVASTTGTIYKLNTAIITVGGNYSVGDEITTDIKLYQDVPSSISIDNMTETLTNVVIDKTTFETNIHPTQSENLIFKFKETENAWQLNGNNVAIADYGITYTGTPEEDDELHVIYLIAQAFDPIKITVTGVSDTGTLVEVTTNYDNDILDNNPFTVVQTYTDDVNGGAFEFSCNPYLGGALMKSNLSNSQVVESRDYASKIYYEESKTDIDPVTSVYKVSPTLQAIYKSTNNKVVVSCSGTAVNRYDISNTLHTNWSTAAQLSTQGSNGVNKHGVCVTEDGAYYCAGSWDFSRDNLISTIGYCDEKQNTQNIEVISDSTTISLDPQKAIYSITLEDSATLTIDDSNLVVAENTAKTFEVYVTVGATLPTVTWIGIDKWLADSEQTPLNSDTTSIFTIRVQNIGGTKTIIANYGGEY